MWGGAFDPTLGYYIINTTDSGALHFIQNEPDPKPAPLYADPDGRSPILYSTKPNTAQSAISFSAYSFSAPTAWMTPLEAAAVAIGAQGPATMAVALSAAPRATAVVSTGLILSLGIGTNIT